MKIIKKAKEIFKRLWKILTRPDMLILPGQLAFFLLLAIVPMFTLIIYGVSLFHVSFDFISNLITKAFGSEITNLIIPMIEDIHIGPEFLWPLCVAFYAASAGAGSIIICSNKLFHFENSDFLKRKIKGLLMTFILVSLVVFLLLIPAFGNKVIELLQFVNMNEGFTNFIAFIINMMKGPASWLLIFMLIKILYTMAPDQSIPSSYTTKGSLFTTFGFVISTGIYSFYVNHMAHYDILYGGLSHFVVLMIWFYIIAYMVTIGIAINSEELKKMEKIGTINNEN